MNTALNKKNSKEILHKPNLHNFYKKLSLLNISGDGKTLGKDKNFGEKRSKSTSEKEDGLPIVLTTSPHRWLDWFKKSLSTAILIPCLPTCRLSGN